MGSVFKRTVHKCEGDGFCAASDAFISRSSDRGDCVLSRPSVQLGSVTLSGGFPWDGAGAVDDLDGRRSWFLVSGFSRESAASGVERGVAEHQRHVSRMLTKPGFCDSVRVCIAKAHQAGYWRISSQSIAEFGLKTSNCVCSPRPANPTHRKDPSNLVTPFKSVGRLNPSAAWLRSHSPKPEALPPQSPGLPEV